VTRSPAYPKRERDAGTLMVNAGLPRYSRWNSWKISYTLMLQPEQVLSAEPIMKPAPSKIARAAGASHHNTLSRLLPMPLPPCSSRFLPVMPETIPSWIVAACTSKRLANVFPLMAPILLPGEALNGRGPWNRCIGPGIWTLCGLENEATCVCV